VVELAVFHQEVEVEEAAAVAVEEVEMVAEVEEAAVVAAEEDVMVVEVVEEVE